MSLARRLADMRARGLLPSSGGIAPAGPRPGLEAPLELPPSPGPGGRRAGAPPEELAQALDGRILTTGAGDAVLVEHRFPLDHRHGQRPLSDMTDAPLDRLVWLTDADLAQTPPEPPLRLEDLVFWDTETSGLAGGTGTYVILVGLGRFSGGSFVVRQFLLTHPGEEEPFLEGVTGEMVGARALVSFNGRAFDTPQLETRLILARRREAAARLGKEPIHLDLLHPARRLYRGDLGTCSLASLEQHVLGVDRQDDLPGWLVPERYRSYLDDGSADHLEPILRHNLDDILSLVGLAGLLAVRAAAGADSSPPRGYPPPLPGELYGLARTYSARGHEKEAADLFKALLARLGRRGSGGGFHGGIRLRATAELAAIYRRRGRWDQAEKLWNRWLEEDESAASVADALPYIELAKILEHRRRDLPAALRVARRGLDAARRRERLGSRRIATQAADLEHRIRRLERRLAVRDSRQPRGPTAPGA